MGYGALSYKGLEGIVSRETTDNFWHVMSTFQWPESQPVTYRLYHDDDGNPLFYSMQDLPGTYIEVDQPTYVKAAYNLRVVDGAMIWIRPKITTTQLQRSTDTGINCDHRDVCVVIDNNKNGQKWTLVQNDQH